jgi:hypothetical protein
MFGSVATGEGMVIVLSAFKGEDDEEDNRALLIMLAVVLVAVGAGVMTARAIILGTARKTLKLCLARFRRNRVELR